MSIKNLEKEKFNFQNIDEFKSFILQTIDDEGYYVELGYILDEEYKDNSKDNYHSYKATITCFRSCSDKTILAFKSGYKKLNSIHVYNFFYTDISGYGSLLINDVVLGYNALKAIRLLSD